MSIQDIYNQIADRFERLDRKYWVMGLVLFVALMWIGRTAPPVADRLGISGIAQSFRFLVGRAVFDPLLVLFLQGVASFWLKEAGPAIRRGFVPSALATLLVLPVSWLWDFAIYGRTDLVMFANPLRDLLILFAICWPTIIKFRILSRTNVERPSLSGWWEISLVGILIVPGSVHFVTNLIELLLAAGFWLIGFGSAAYAILVVALMASWYFWFDRMWRVRFNRVLATLHLSAALVGPLTLTIYGIGIDLMWAWGRIQGEDLLSLPASQGELRYSAVHAVSQHVEVFGWISIALFLIVFLEAMVRKMMGGTIQTYDVARARRLRRYAALVLLAGLLFMGGNFLVYFLLSL